VPVNAIFDFNSAETAPYAVGQATALAFTPGIVCRSVAAASCDLARDFGWLAGAHPHQKAARRACCPGACQQASTNAFAPH
jgi:hypothetical protein